MCIDNECPSKTFCHRHEDAGTLTPDPDYQSFALFNREDNESSCDYFIKV